MDCKLWFILLKSRYNTRTFNFLTWIGTLYTISNSLRADMHKAFNSIFHTLRRHQICFDAVVRQVFYETAGPGQLFCQNPCFASFSFSVVLILLVFLSCPSSDIRIFRITLNGHLIFWAALHLYASPINFIMYS